MARGKTSDGGKVADFAKRLYQVAKALEPFVVIASVILILLQLRQQTKLTSAANTQSLVELILPLNMEMVKDKELTRLWLKGARGFDGGEVTDGEIEADRYDTLIASFLIFHENVYLQHRKGLLDDDIYAAWDNDLDYMVRLQHLDKYWDDGKKSKYHPDFSRHVEDLIQKGRTAPAQ